MVKAKGRRKVRIGKIVSCKMDKTAVVAVEMITQHPLYKKTIRKTTKFKIHDEKNECQIGDVVKVAERRPLSREKRWHLISIVEKAE